MGKLGVKGTPEFHRKFFPEFAFYERLGGGPDPHMQLATWYAQFVEDAPWWYGCYVGPYVVSTGEFIHQAWPTAQSVVDDQEGFWAWVHANYKKLEMRRERRAIYGTRRFGNHMIDYAKWCLSFNPPGTSFDADWAYLSTVPMNGRYGTMKLYNAMLEGGLLKHHWYDIRPAGGPTPRNALSWMRPEFDLVLNGGNSPKTLAAVNQIAAEEKEWLRTEKGIDLNWFDFEVLLCEYKQAYDGGQYPGRAHDSELGRALKLEEKVGPELNLKLWEGRRELFPHEPLGELGNRWEGRRGIGSFIREHGYTWSDMLYDYSATTDFANPVRRPNAPQGL